MANGILGDEPSKALILICMSHVFELPSTLGLPLTLLVAFPRHNTLL